MTQLKLIADPAPHATYFYSGSNHAGEILGLAEAQRHSVLRSISWTRAAWP